MHAIACKPDLKLKNSRTKAVSHSTTIKTVPIKSQSALRAAIAELQSNGVNIELQENCKPRMYYKNQIAKQIVSTAKEGEFSFNEDPDVCDFVIHLPDSFYDIGLLRQEDGSYTPVFDDYCGGPVSGAPTTAQMKGIKSILGHKWEGKVEHWAGRKEGNDSQLHSIGKFLQGYTKQTVVEAATLAGHMVSGFTENEKTGEIQVHLSVN